MNCESCKNRCGCKNQTAFTKMLEWSDGSASCSGYEPIAMTDKLKPCPFCGGEAEVIKGYLYGKVTHYSVVCPKCDFEYGMYKSKQNAERAWNRRKAEKDIDRLLTEKFHTKEEIYKAIGGLKND